VSLQLQIDEMSLKLRPHPCVSGVFFFVFARSHLPTVGPSAVFFFPFRFFSFSVGFFPSFGWVVRGVFVFFPFCFFLFSSFLSFGVFLFSVRFLLRARLMWGF
jgi:hypothetical protein